MGRGFAFLQFTKKTEAAGATPYPLPPTPYKILSSKSYTLNSEREEEEPETLQGHLAHKKLQPP